MNYFHHKQANSIVNNSISTFEIKLGLTNHNESPPPQYKYNQHLSKPGHKNSANVVPSFSEVEKNEIQ